MTSKVTKSYRFSQAMVENIKWLASEYDTTETEILDILITYAAARHDDTITDTAPKSEIEKYIEMQVYGIAR